MAELADKRKFYIDGAWVDPAAAHDLEVIDPTTEDDDTRVSRAVAVARGGDAPEGVGVEIQGHEIGLEGDPVRCGVMAQRLVSALWAEGIGAHLDSESARPVVQWHRNVCRG